MNKTLLKKFIPACLHPVTKRTLLYFKQLKFVQDYTYQIWLKKFDSLSPADKQKLTETLKHFNYRPTISIILTATNADFLKATTKSIQAQIYSNYELILINDAQNSSINKALASAQGEFISFMNAGDILPPQALFYVVKALNQNQNLDLIYTDSDDINQNNQRSHPYFKSNWDPYLFLTQNYLSPFWVARKSLINSLGGLNSEFAPQETWDLLLRLTEKTDQIYHIPRILYHARKSKKPLANNFITQGQKVIAAALKRRNLKAEVSLLTQAPYYRIHFKLPTISPLVSIIIPTKDRIDLLKPAIDSILTKTTYQNFEILIVNNNSQKPETFAYFKSLTTDKIKILDYPYAFNFSAINNFAVSQAQGEILVFMNNDTEVITPDWLTEMLSLILLSKDVGAVGAKLYYPNDTIQYAGGVLGIGGVAAHTFPGYPRNSDGYFSNLQSLHLLSFVTAACLMTKRSVFTNVGGFDSEHLAIAFNDVDLCLKIKSAGYNILWTPNAEIYHKESASRGKENNPEKISRFQKEYTYMQNKWGQLLIDDPYYNPNLTLHNVYYELATPPRIDTFGIKDASCTKKLKNI